MQTSKKFVMEACKFSCRLTIYYVSLPVTHFCIVQTFGRALLLLVYPVYVMFYVGKYSF